MRNNNAVGIFIEYQNKFLIIRRLAGQHEGNKWGLVGGKIEEGETPLEAISREIIEETDLHISNGNILFLKTFDLAYQDGIWCFHVFKAVLDKKPKVKINPEIFQDYKWVTRQQCLKLPELMSGLITILKDQDLF
jgi:mutator protein MutT